MLQALVVHLYHPTDKNRTNCHLPPKTSVMDHPVTTCSLCSADSLRSEIKISLFLRSIRFLKGTPLASRVGICVENEH